DRGLSDRFVRDERALDLHRAEAVARNVYHVVHAPHNPEVSVLVSARAVAREVYAVNLAPVLLAVTLVVAPDGSEHRRPGALDDEVAALVRLGLLPRLRHDGGLDAGQRPCRRAGLRRRRARKRAYHYRAGLGLPPRVN